ncbi:transposase IS200-family protein (plasmid) [Peptoclostridium acidaminophilum DSM 3953]|uniref:Transposase IS200-family protein n=2 Tax=Peptoclostridium acidaminophilum TaxID=1731 RepID=W8TJS0_PEPAC|nr:transposase IS200-family protein [Peptoclostridium acidaminophilum DSM 3953]
MLQYHIVWSTKYRRKILNGNTETNLKRILYEIAESNGFTIETMETDEDHIHLLVSCSPQHYIPNIIKALKGNSARALFKAIPELKKQLWGGHLWNPSYFVATVSENTREQIKRYIENQQVK